MREQEEVAKFAHLQYKVLHDFEITIPEYWYLDMVYQLSRSGWCFKSLDNIALDMRMTKNGVVKLRDRLTERGLIIKGRAGKVKTSVKYNSVYFSNPRAYNSVTNRTTKYNSAVQLSGTKNNNKNNLDKRGLDSKNKERIRNALKQGKLNLLKQQS